TFYVTVLFAGLIAALIMPRILPLSRYSNKYIKATTRTIDDTAPSEMNSVIFGYQKALETGKQETSVYQFFKNGFQHVLDMWMGVAPIVMAFGLIALILAEYTPIFQWIGLPFIPLLELMQVPEAAKASETL